MEPFERLFFHHRELSGVISCKIQLSFEDDIKMLNIQTRKANKSQTFNASLIQCPQGNS